VADWEPVGDPQEMQSEPLDVISPSEGKLRQDSGGYLANGSPAPRAALVDQGEGSSAPSTAPSSAQTTWTPDGAAQDIAPTPMRQMATPAQEANYQAWVAQHRVPDAQGNPTNALQTPGMGNRNVTVDPYGNGVDVDLRGLYSQHASHPFTTGNPLDSTAPPTLDPTPQQLNQYTLPSSGRLTKDSIFAPGRPDTNIGSWGTDENGAPEYHQPGWTPATRTKQVMDAASNMADKAAGVSKDAGDELLNNVTDPVTGMKRAASNAGDTSLAALKGLGGEFHKLAETVNILGGAFPVAYDKAKSLATGKDTTEAQDAWFKSAVDPLTSQDEAFELGKNAGMPEKVAHMFGSSLGWVSQMILTGGEAEPLAAGASGGAALKAAIKHNVPAAGIPATTDAIDTGRKVYAETGDGKQAFKAAQVQYITSSLGAIAPLHTTGSLIQRLAQGAAAGSVTGEAGRQAMNTVLPKDMQTPFTGEGAALSAIGGATIAGIGGRRPGDADFKKNEGADAEGKPFDVNDVSPERKGLLPAPESNWSDPKQQYADLKTAMHAAKTGDTATAEPIVARAHDEADAAQAASDASPKDQDLAQKAKTAQQFADYLTKQTGIDPRAPAEDTSPRKLTAPERRAQTQAKTDDIAEKADDSGEITTEHGPNGSIVNVADKPVHAFDTKGAAESAATDARTQVDERRTDGMAPDEKADTLETHGVTGIPNRAAYENAEKKPVQASIEADSLGPAADKDSANQVATAIATALHDEAPGDAFHLSGNQFVVQGETHNEVSATIEAVRQRLDKAQVELTAPDGHTVTLDGIGISHGTGSTLDAADSALQSEKSRAPALPSAAGNEPGEPSEPVHSAGLSADEPANAGQGVAAPPDEHTHLGGNADGEPIFEDKHGIRSVLDKHGTRHTESVAMVPTRSGIKFNRADPDHPRFTPTKAEPAEPAAHADLSEAESKFVKTIGDRTLGKYGQQPVANLVHARKLYQEITGVKAEGETLKRVDELVERAIVEKAREVVADGEEPKLTYQRLVNLYNRQPSLNTRTSTSIENQAYSTPAPLAFLASDLAGITRKSTVLEPTAGNGMLLIAADPAHAIVNELNDERAASLKAQGFDVTQRDASDQVLSDKPVDVVIANPPFGVVRDVHGESKSFTLTTPSGKSVKTNEIDHAIVLKQLAAMKPDGRAVLLIGGVNKLAKGPARSDAYNGAAKRKFFYHLYNNYNVVDHFTVSGDLYSRQGAAWPIDVIVVHGTGKSALQLPAASVPREYNDYPALEALLGKTYESPAANRVDTAAQAPANTAGGGALQPETTVRPGVVPEPARGPDSSDGGRITGPEGSDSSVAGGDVLDRPGEGRSPLQDGASGDRPGGGEPVRGGEAEQLGRVSETGEGALPAGGQPDGAPSADVGQGQPGGRASDVGDSDGSGGVGAERAYKPKSKAGSLDTLVPANMEHAVGRALDHLESKVGPIDEYVAKELGYKKGELGKYFGAEQVDALGLAIHQIGKGKGFIIGDQTGIGKGRVVAGIIRYAIKNGHTPIFVTEKPNLYGDMVRDLRNIGMDDIRPLMTNAGEKIPVESGGEIKSAGAALHNKILQRVVNEAKLSDHNMLFTTYSQIQVQGKRALRHEALDTLVPNAVMVLDESHNAGGTDAGRSNKQKGEEAGSKTGRAALVRGYVGRAKGVFYSSATYAKRPSVMDLYSKTDMSLAVGGNVAKLPGAIQAGGVPLQQVVASQLSDAGQYLRRERSFKGVDYNTPTVPVDRDAAETLASIMLSIKEFDDKKAGAVAAAKEDAKATAAQVSEDGSKGAAGAQSTNFTSSMHNLIGQMLLGLKADKAASMAVEALKRGEKPVITVANTMGSFIEQYAEAAHLKGGDRIGIAFNDLAKRYLESSRNITIKDVDGNKTKRRMSDEELGPEAVAAFNRVKKIINEAKSIASIPISPIDYIHKKLKDAGYTSAELTGRTHTIEYQDDGEAIYRQRGGKETSAGGKVKSISDFNNGKTDAMVLNQSGASGLSLHASSTFKNQQRRNMIIAQAEGNIDTHMQILGRVHRTGQVIPPEYNQLVADIPAEKRPAAVLAKKMASLSANTTGARSGNFTSKETVDFLNSYGDEVAAQLMADMPEVHEKLGEPLDSGNDGYDNEEAARKVTGRIPMLPVHEQEELYNLLESGYRERLAQADAMGENALEAKTLPLDAKPLKKVVLSAATSGDSPFAAASHAETMDVKRVGKPYTSADVRAIVAKELGMEGEPSLSQLADRGRRVGQQTMQDTKKAYQEYRNGEEAKMLASEQKEAAIAGRLVALDGVAHRWTRVADLIHVGGSYEFTMPDGSAMMGVVTEVFKKKGVKMPVALGSWAAKIALADGSKQMTVPFSKVQLPSESVMPGKIQMAPRIRNPATGVGIEKMFDDGQSVSRENRVIITGNLLAGFAHIRGGQVIHFTDNKGEVRQGIMMPRSFKLDEFVENAPVHMPPDRAVQFFTNAQQGILKSADGAVTLARWGNEYAMNVAKSKAEGGKYFLDNGLRQITGDFVSVGTGMRAMLNKDQVPRALEYIQRKFEQRFDTTTFRQEALAAGGTSIGTEKAKTASMARDEVAPGDARPSHAIVKSTIDGVLDKFGTKFKAVHLFPTAEALFDSKFGPALRAAGETPGSFKAFVTPDGQYVAASDQFHSIDDVKANVAHEFVGHFGLDAMYGGDPRYQQFLDGVAQGFPEEMQRRGDREYAGQYDPENEDHRNRAAREVAAYYAQRYAKSQSIPSRMRRLLDRLFQIIRDFGRKVMGLSPKFDEAWLRGQIAGFEQYMRKSRSGGADPMGEPAFGKNEPTFYSAVERAVESGKRDKGTGVEWEATLRNTPGVKADEMKWLGLKEWLEGRGRVTRAEVADYVRAHKLELGEVWHGQADNDHIIEQLRQHGYGVEENLHGDPQLTLLNEQDERDRVPPEVVKLLNQLEEVGTKFQDRSEPGGKNYRELLLTLPQKISAEQQALRDYGDAMVKKYGRMYGPSDLSEQEIMQRHRLAMLASPLRSANSTYRSSHWDEPNIVAHVRFDDRTGPNGEKVLHLAEVQSDWHQAGRKRGYQDDAALVAAKADREDGYWKVSTADDGFVTNVQDHDNPGVKTAQDAINVANFRLREALRHTAMDDRVPEAPFKTTWADLAMKRVLRHAAENGYHALSWDVGDTHSERYNMGNEVDSIRVVGQANHLYDVLATRNGRTVVERQGTPEGKLSDLLGKDMAQRAITARDEPQGITFKGDDLKIGGAGMRGFYDDMLPKKMQALTKKWGGNVERTIVGDGPHTDIASADERDDTQLPAHMLRITDAMREGVMEGQPQFARDGNSFARAELENDDESPKSKAGARRRTKAAQVPDDVDQSVRGPKAYMAVRNVALQMINNPLTMELRTLFNPKDLSPLSKSTAATTTAFLGELAQQLQATVHNLERFSRAMDRLNPNDLLDIDDDFENGRPQRNAEYQPMADELRRLLDTWAKNVQDLGEGHLENLIENYLPHVWTDFEKAKSTYMSAMARRPMRGPMTFLKKRTIPTLREGIDMGLTPLTLNPLILTLLKVHEMQKFVSGVTMMRAYKASGLARYFPATMRTPDGWVKINDAIARVSQWSETEHGFIERGYYAMPEDAALIINNHLGSTVLDKSAIAKGLRVFSNALIGFQLGFSGFHLGFTTNDAVVSKMALAVERLVHGEPLKAAAAFGEVMIGPVSAGLNLRRGAQLMRAYADPAGATPEMRQLVEAFTGGGGRMTMDRYFQAAQGISPFRGVGVVSLAGDVRQAMTQPKDKVAAVTKALGSFPLEYAQRTWQALRNFVHMYPPSSPISMAAEAAGRLSRGGTSFIMEHIVPMQKMGVWTDLAKDWLRRNPGALPVERNNAMQSIWRSVDNRLGEVVYDNKFWNRTFKFALHLSLRAVGWRFGTLEEIGGGVTDVLKALDKFARTGKLSPEDFTHKMAYILGLTMVQAISGALLQYIMSGEGPRDLKDLMFPRTGRRHKDGTEERLSLPSYVKDVYEYLHHPGKAALNMANPAYGVAKEQITGKDWKDQPYLNPDASDMEWWEEHAKHLVGGFTPMSLSPQSQFEGAKEPGWRGEVWKHLPQFGLTSAPSYITKPEQMDRQQHERDEKDYEKALGGKIRAARAAGDTATAEALIKEVRDSNKKLGENKASDAKARKAAPPPQHKTSALIDQVGPLLDQGGSRAQMARRVHDAGYPALAGLLGAMPERLRPQVRAAIEREAS
jgi:hypothetical protein